MKSTINEMANKWIKDRYEYSDTPQELVNAEREGYIYGAERMYEMLIDKACEWLNENATYMHPRKGVKTCMINLNMFREAMKG